MQIANAFGEQQTPVAYIDYEQGGIASKNTLDSINRNTTEKGRRDIAIKSYLEKHSKNYRISVKWPKSS